MRIEPQANNAVRIILEDGYAYDINTAEHGGRSFLYIKPTLEYLCTGRYALEIAQLDTSAPGEWQPLVSLPHFIRIRTVRRNDV